MTQDLANDMTRGRPLPHLIRFALPLMLSSILQQLYTVCDSMIVGRLISTEAFAAIGSSSFIQWLPMGMLISCSHGFSVVLAQRFGAKDEQGLRQAFASSLLLSTLIAGLLMTVGILFLQPFLQLLGTPVELTGYTSEYLRILFLGLIPTALYNVSSSSLRALGDSQTPFVALIVATLLNIALDFLFLGAFHMGVGGAALATILSQVVATFYCMLRIRTIHYIMPARADWKPERKTVHKLLRMGIPMMLSNAVISIGELSMLAATNAFGVVFVTGMTASQRYFSLMSIAGSALEGSVATFVGQNAGAKQADRIIEGTRTAVLLGVISAFFTAALVILFRKPLIMLFVPAANAAAIQFGMDALTVEALGTVFLYLLCLHRAALQGMGNAIIPMLSGFTELALRLSWVFLFVGLIGREGLYFTDSITWIGTAAFLMIAYFIKRRKMLAKICA